MRPNAPFRVLLLAALSLSTPLACGQSESPVSGETTTPAGPGVRPQPEATTTAGDPMRPVPETDRPAAALAARSLGHRAAAIRLSQKVIPVVVIVDDGASFAEAISGWDQETRYPVLWDDGSVAAGEHVARFVRAFAPERVVRWDSKKAWPEDRRSREKQILDARSAALGLTPRIGQNPDEALLDWIATINYDPAGVVVTDANDTAWPAALALSAGRLQPIVFLNSVYGSPSGGMNTDRAENIDKLIRDGLDERNVVYQGLGEGVDAVTLVGGFPVRVMVGEDDYRSFTDRIGRTSSVLGTGGSLTEETDRWAWSGQVFGDEPYAAYAAMCSLFLQTDSLWAFNTYAKAFAPSYALAEPAKILEENMGFTATVYNGDDTLGLGAWRAAVSRGGIDAGLVLVNTHGNAPEFNFNDKTRAYAGDVPLLSQPAIVQFIHSYSMQRPDNPDTVGGRWLSHGAYAYVGSMHEPYLDAFVPPVSFAARLAEGWAFGAAARANHRGWWRITTHGDPLITLGPAGTRTDTPLPLTGTTDLADSMRDALARKDYAAAVRSLVLQGRDHDAARLVASLMADQPAQVSRAVAEAGVGPMFRDRNFAGVIDLWRYVGPQAVSTPALSDALWGAARMQLITGDRTTGERSAALSRLKQNMRPEQQAEDATEIADWIARDEGPRAAAAYLGPIQTRLKADARARRILAKAIKSHGG